MAPSPELHPWTWALDQEFFGALARWTIENPPGSIDRLLDKINSGIHNIQDLINFIPDSPFPARGLIQALCQLIQIGTVCILVDISYYHAKSRSLQRLY
jgi:hypothetical protein